ncbi:MAG: hypothetical protein CME66_03570 [Halobacteriovoraceae bacterium]|nr:hypothetical protein [Halobacteriovoraceae bacterium]
MSSRSTVTKYINDFGIAKREVGSNKNRKRGVPYGYEFVDGELKEVTSEQEVISLIAKLRKLEMSFGKIARVLNDQQVPTKNKVKLWDRKTVYVIYQRSKK